MLKKRSMVDARLGSKYASEDSADVLFLSSIFDY